MVAESSNGQRISLKFDIGAIKQESVKSVVVRYHNKSAVSKKLVFSSASCGCLKVTDMPEVVDPNGNCDISFDISTKGKHGKVNESAFFKSPDNEGFLLVITFAAVISGTWCEPNPIHLGTIQSTIQRGKSSSQILRVFTAGQAPKPEIVSITADSDALVLERKTEVLSKDDSRKDIDLLASIKIEMKAGRPALGAFHSNVIIVTNSSMNPRLTIPITAHLIGRARICPPLFNFGHVALGTHPQRHVTLSIEESVEASKQLTFKTDNPFVAIKTERDTASVSKAQATWTILASLKEGPDVPRRTIAGQVSIFLGDEQIGSIPYAAFVSTSRR